MAPPRTQIDALLVHDGSLRALARGLLADPHSAEDVAQEAWLAALERGGEAESLPRWLSGVVKNLAAKLRRGEVARERREHDSARHEAGPSPAEILAREAARTRVVEAVLALEDPYRATVLLRYFENLPPRAIAQRHAVPVETVRTRLKRALETLRLRLDREFDGGRGAWATLLVPLARGPLAPRLLPPWLAATLMSTQVKIAGTVAAAALLLFFVQSVRGSKSAAEPRPPEPAPLAQLRSPATEERAEIAAAPPAERVVASAPVAPSARFTDEPVGSLLLSITWSDEAPAEGIHVRVETAWSSGNPGWRAREVVTGSDGTALLEGLPIGRALVDLDRGDGDTVMIEAGQQSTLALRLGLGFDVAGVVLDPLGQPVAGAEIWLSSPFTLDEQGSVVARSSADGGFLLRSCTGGAVFARATRFAPSLLQPLEATEGSTLELELVLMGPGGELNGHVFDPEGEPVPVALVLVEPLGFLRHVETMPVGGTRVVTGLSAPAQDVRGDDAGRFVVAGVAPGVRKVAVRAPGHALWRGEAEVFEHASTTLDVHLVRGVVVEGRVVDAAGQPVREADVSWELAQDGLDRLSTATSTDVDGHFRLADLGPGEFELLAEARSHRARAMLHGAAGETITWNPVLANGGTIRGRLVDEQGMGVADHYVMVEDEPPLAADACGQVWAARTDANGRFTLDGLGNHGHRIEAHAIGPVLFPLAVASGVFPDGDDVLLRIEPERRPSVYIAGTVVDASGRPVLNAEVRASNPAYRRSPSVTTDAEGRFELGPCPPGNWKLHVSAPPELASCPPVDLGPTEVAAESSWDCGNVVLAPR